MFEVACFLWPISSVNSVHVSCDTESKGFTYLLVHLHCVCVWGGGGGPFVKEITKLCLLVAPLPLYQYTLFPYGVKYFSAGGDKKADVGAGADAAFQFVSAFFL